MQEKYQLQVAFGVIWSPAYYCAKFRLSFVSEAHGLVRLQDERLNIQESDRRVKNILLRVHNVLITYFYYYSDTSANEDNSFRNHIR